MKDAEWNELRDRWQNMSEVVVGVRRDVEKAKNRRRRDDIHDLIAVLVAVSLPWVIVVSDPDPVVLVCLLFVTVFILVMVFVSQNLKRKRRLVLAEPATDFVEVLIKHHETEKRLHRYEGVGLATVTIFVLAWVPWTLWANRAVYAENMWSAVIGVGGIVVILAGVFVIHRREATRLRDEAGRLEQIRSEYEGDL